MDLQNLAKNMKRLRSAGPKLISQQKLAELAGLSRPTIKNLERAKGEPRASTCLAISRALGVKLRDLFMPVRELKSVRFRSAKSMRTRQNILADVSRWLDDFEFLEEVLDQRHAFKLKMIEGKFNGREAVEAAGSCRAALGLKPTEPIYDICGLLEDAGVKVYPISCASEGFFGLSVGKEDGGPAVIVNTWDKIPVERRIFSTAHEFGHLVLHRDAFDVEKADENKQEEKEADVFAAHFLMPDGGFQKHWADAAGLHKVDGVLKVKRIFRVSYKTVLRRLIDHGVADSSVWQKFNVAYQQRFDRSLRHKEEPDGIDEDEPIHLQDADFREDRFSRLVRQAVDGGEISLARGAEILRISIKDMRELFVD